MRESDRDRPDDHSTAIEDENDVPFNQVDDVRATEADNARFDDGDNARLGDGDNARFDDGDNARFDDGDNARFDDGDDVSFEKSVSPADEPPTDEDALDAPEAMPIVPEQISLENAAFVVLGVALTVVVILTAV